MNSVIIEQSQYAFILNGDKYYLKKDRFGDFRDLELGEEIPEKVVQEYMESGYGVCVVDTKDTVITKNF